MTRKKHTKRFGCGLTYLLRHLQPRLAALPKRHPCEWLQERPSGWQGWTVATPFCCALSLGWVVKVHKNPCFGLGSYES